MRMRGCLISFGALAALSLICCVLLWFVGLPRLQDSIADGLSDGLATEVAEQLGGPGVDLGPGTHTISMADLERQMRASGETDNVDDINFSAENGRLELSFGSQGQSFGYIGDPVAEDGQLVMTNVESEGGGWVDQFFPADKLAGAIEDGVNAYFAAQGLEIVSVTAENNELVVETAETGQ